MKSVGRARFTMAMSVVATIVTIASSGLETGELRSASADESGLSTDDPAPAPHRYALPREPRGKAPAAAPAKGRAGFGRGDGQLDARVVLLDEPAPQDAPPVPLAADLADQTLSMGLSREPALVASLVGLGCFLGWRGRRKVARRGAWAH